MFCWYPAVTCTAEPCKPTLSKPCLSKTGSFYFVEGRSHQAVPCFAQLRGESLLCCWITPAGHPPHQGSALSFQPLAQRITTLLRWRTGSCLLEQTLEKGLSSLSSAGPGCLPGPPPKPRDIGCRWEPLFLSCTHFLLLFKQTCCGRKHLWKHPITGWI